MDTEQNKELMKQQAEADFNNYWQDNLKSIGDDLAVQEQLMKPKIDTVMFREVFLPFFANDAEKKYPDVGIQHWLSIARHPFQVVDLVDQEGSIIAEVPPLKDRSVLVIKDPLGTKAEETGKHQRLYDVWATVSMLKDRSYNTAERLFAEQIAGRLAEVGTRELIIKHTHAWNTIYDYYGREMPFPDIERLLDEITNPEAAKVSDKPKKQSELVLESLAEEYDDELA